MAASERAAVSECSIVAIYSSYCPFTDGLRTAYGLLRGLEVTGDDADDSSLFQCFSDEILLEILYALDDLSMAAASSLCRRIRYLILREGRDASSRLCVQLSAALCIDGMQEAVALCREMQTLLLFSEFICFGQEHSYSCSRAVRAYISALTSKRALYDTTVQIDVERIEERTHAAKVQVSPSGRFGIVIADVRCNCSMTLLYKTSGMWSVMYKGLVSSLSFRTFGVRWDGDEIVFELSPKNSVRTRHATRVRVTSLVSVASCSM